MDEIIKYITAISAVVALIGSAAAVIISARKGRREADKLDAEASEVWQRVNAQSAAQLATVQTALQLEQTQRLALETQVKTLSANQANLLERVRRLEAQVVSLGGTPVQ